MTINTYDPGNPRDWKESVLAVAVAAPAAYNRVGNVITAAAVGAMPNIDTSAVPAVGSRILLALSPANVDNGIYEVTSLGSGIAAWSMKRAADCNSNANFTDGMTIPVEQGTVYGEHAFKLTTANVIVNTTATLFVDGGSLTLVTQITDGTVVATGAQAGCVFTTGVPTVGGRWLNDLNVQPGAVTFPSNPTVDTGSGAWTLSTATMRHGAGVVSPVYSQADIATAGATANTLTVHAQTASDAAGPAANTGGGLALHAGDAAGPLASVGGSVTVLAGDATAAGVGSVGGNITIRPGHAATHGELYLQNAAGGAALTVQNNNELLLNAPSGCAIYFRNNSNDWAQLSGLGWSWVNSCSNVYWGANVAAPTLYQATDGTAGVTADTLTLHAQTASDATAPNVGGGLALHAGDAAGTLASTGGAVTIQAGNATAAGVGSVGGNVTITPGTGATSGLTKVTAGSVWFDGTTGATPTSGAGTRLMWIPAKAAFRAGSASGTQFNDANIGVGSVAMGEDVIASAQDSVAFGTASTASGFSSFAIGRNAAASGTESVALGNASYATTDTCYSFGTQVRADFKGQFSRAGGTVNGAGHSQRSDIGLIRTSTDAGAVELTITGGAPGAGTRFTMTAEKLYGFTLCVTCVCTAGTNIGASAVWHIHGAIRRVGATTSLLGTPQVLREGAVSVACNVAATPTHADAALAAATVQVTADDGSDCIAVSCVGVVGGVANSFHWNGTLYLTEVL